MASARRAVAPAVTAVVTSVCAAAAARATYAALTRNPPGGAERWTRTNHRGEAVTLLEGPAAALAGAIAAATAPGVPARSRAALVAAATGAAAFGGYDDLAGSGDRRGFRGHLGALAHGQVTTGAVKIGGIGATGVAAAALNGGPAADVAINGALVASSANLLNLFDLRPGRALKVALAAGVPLGISQLVRRTGRGGRAAAVAVPVGAAVALLPEDLGERAMLGDAGANALGALLGAAAAGSLSRRSRLAILAVITGLTAASEVVSFTKVIQRTPPLHWLDMLGRRPAHAARSAGCGRSASSAAPAPAPATSAAPDVTVPAPSVPAPSVPAPSVPAPSVPAPSVPAPSVPAPSGSGATSGAAPEHNAVAAPPSP
jgi:hypothetical protein